MYMYIQYDIEYTVRSSRTSLSASVIHQLGAFSGYPNDIHVHKKQDSSLKKDVRYHDGIKGGEFTSGKLSGDVGR